MRHSILTPLFSWPQPSCNTAMYFLVYSLQVNRKLFQTSGTTLGKRLRTKRKLMKSYRNNLLKSMWHLAGPLTLRQTQVHQSDSSFWTFSISTQILSLANTRSALISRTLSYKETIIRTAPATKNFWSRNSAPTSRNLSS